MTTVPTTMNCQNASTLSITNPVVRIAMISAPITVPMTVPAPPNRLTPADDHRGDRGQKKRIANHRGAGGEAKRRQEAGDPGGRGGKDIKLDGVAIDRDAGAHRRFHAAADRVSMAAELGFVQQEH